VITSTAVRSRVLLGAIALGALAVVIRLWLAWSFHGNYDQESYEIVRDIVDRGGNVYSETYRYNYSPVWFLLIGVFSRISDATGVPFQFVIRATLTAIDVLTALLLFVAAGKLGMSRERALLPGLIFLTNPVSIAVTGFQGQFDNVAILLVLAAVIVQLDGPRTRAAGILLTIGVVVKQTVAPLVLFVLSGSIKSPLGRLIAAVGIGVVFVLTLLPFAFAPGAALGILTGVFAYGAFAGYTASTTLFVAFGAFRVTLLALTGFLAHKLPLHRAAAFGGIILTVAAGPSLWNTQYLVLPLALASLTPSPMYLLFTATAMVEIAHSKEYLNLVFPFDWEIMWAVSIGWAVECLWLSLREMGASSTADRPQRLTTSVVENPVPAD
jgi:hypothetical protein